MTTGKPASGGTSKASLMAAILEHEPEPLKPPTPPALDRLIRACLAKDPDERIQSAHDVKLQLKAIGESADVTAERRRPRALLFTSIAAIALVAVVASFIVGRSLKAPSDSRSDTTQSRSRRTRLSLCSRTLFLPSHRRNRLVYVAATEPHQLMLRPMTTSASRRCGTEGARNPFFSPDGEWIGFEADRFLKKVSLAGGDPVTICTAWNTRGAPGGQTMKLSSLRTGAPCSAFPPPGQAATTDSIRDGQKRAWPIILPGGKTALYTVADYSGTMTNAKIVAVSLENGRSRLLLEGATNPQYTSGHLLYLHSGTLFSISFDPVT